MKDDDKITVSNSLKDIIGKVDLNSFPTPGNPPRLIMTSKTITNPDGSKDYVATCVSSNIAEAMRDGVIKGVVLKGSRLEDTPLDIYGREDGYKKIPEAEFAEDETYALPGDKGVVAEVLPDDQLPADTDGNKAEMLTSERPISLIGGDYYYDTLHTFPSHAVIPVHAKPKTRINRQRQGYSRRKAKRAFQTRAVHRVKLTRYRRLHTCYFLLVDDNGNPVNAKNDQFIGRVSGDIHIAETYSEYKFSGAKPEVGSFTQPTKPTPYGKGDING